MCIEWKSEHCGLAILSRRCSVLLNGGLDGCQEKSYNVYVNKIFNLTSASFEGNRESGENPERSGHCNGEFIRNMSLGESLRRRGMEMIPESGNLLGKSLVNSFRREHESKQILIICQTEYQLLLL